MKDIHISGHRIWTELRIMLVCFLVSVCLNVYAIIYYKGSWSELFTSILYVLMATAVLYALWTLLRLIVYGVRRLFRNS